MDKDGAEPAHDRRDAADAGDRAGGGRPPSGRAAAGRKVIVVIGIDRYRSWRPLGNAVRDAHAVRSLFLRLGFEELVGPLLDDHATREAMHALVDDLRSLGSNDSLVVYFAGHGGTLRHRRDGKELCTGYLIPADADNTPGRVASWVELEAWLRNLALLDVRHILVMLDACYSGMALSPLARCGRDGSAGGPASAPERPRRSRMIITSALADQRALDGGPMPGHSLFAGCLIEAMTGAMAIDYDARGRGMTTGPELACHLRRRVSSCAGGPGWQTPDFGSFDFDEGGEMAIPVLAAPLLADLAARAELVKPRRRWHTLREFCEGSSLIRLPAARPPSASSGLATPLPSASSSGRAATVSLQRRAVPSPDDPVLRRVALVMVLVLAAAGVGTCTGVPDRRSAGAVFPLVQLLPPGPLRR